MKVRFDAPRWLCWFYTAIFFAILYRVGYGWLLYHYDLPGIYFKRDTPILSYLIGFTEDVKVSLLLAGIGWILDGIAETVNWRMLRRVIAGVGGAMLVTIVAVQLMSWFSARFFYLPLNYINLQVAWEMSSFSGLLKNGIGWLVLAGLAPLGWYGIHQIKGRIPHRIVLLGLLSVSILPYVKPFPFGDHTDLSVLMNPLRYLQLSYEVCRHRVGRDWEISTTEAQWASPRWTDPRLVGDRVAAPIRFRPERVAQEWDVVFVVVEAMGARYPQDTSLEGKAPMPFLSDLARRGVWLKNHYASGNNTAPALFSLFSGRYPPLNHSYLSATAEVPLVHQMLPGYRTFLVRPADRRSFFPTKVFENSGFPEILDFHALSKVPVAPSHLERREEVGSMRRFREEILRREKIFAIYQSFVPHFYYEDNGEEYRRFALKESDDYAKYFLPRYYNGLYLMDCQIRDLVRMLEESGRMKRTILVVVGDHGEGFEQHPECFMHGMHAFDEIIHSFALIYQPDLFPAQEVSLPTSHTDLLPTLLRFLPEARPAVMSGEDLTREVSRRYVFSDAYVFRGEVVSISRDQVKYFLNDRLASVKRTDLKVDPMEKNFQPAEHDEQFKATALYRQLQRRSLMHIRQQERGAP